ncbi:MAG: YdcF family protein [Propionibacteriaceae bacterium]|jgi:uncharacterized SAM-binding protein YcdF (DUF218 family)|nr:YdcF family protein [Propionibacteriaceae bacterium]
MLFAVPTAFWLVLFAWTVWREPRRMRAGIFLMLALVPLVLWGLIVIIGLAGVLIPSDSNTAETLTLLGAMALVPLTVVVLGVILVLNGITVLRREGLRLSNTLSLLLGLAMLGYLAAFVWSLIAYQGAILLGVATLGVPAAFLAFVFLAYLLYSWLYQHFSRRLAKPARAVVILGSGLIGGKVPPLLASRLDTGKKVYSLSEAKGTTPVVIVSGGRGHDEPRSEASAMREYMVEHGVAGEDVLMEDLSRSTAENLGNTKELLVRHQVTGPVAVVTNNFHAFRSALLMRRAGIPGYVIGSPTAGYYWPSATIREFIAIIRDYKKWMIVGLSLSCTPLLLVIASLLHTLVV